MIGAAQSLGALEQLEAMDQWCVNDNMCEYKKIFIEFFFQFKIRE
jgi:hypothetical protein